MPCSTPDIVQWMERVEVMSEEDRSRGGSSLSKSNRRRVVAQWADERNLLGGAVVALEEEGEGEDGEDEQWGGGKGVPCRSTSRISDPPKGFMCNETSICRRRREAEMKGEGVRG
jgi:hypothetical protein